MSSEIVEIEEDCKSIVSSRNGETSDVYIAVGKNDLHVVKWALDHAVSPGSRVFLVHVFPPLTYISTPAGKLSRSRLSHEQVRAYVSEEGNKRKYLLEKYIRLCNDAKVCANRWKIYGIALFNKLKQQIDHLLVFAGSGGYNACGEKGNRQSNFRFNFCGSHHCPCHGKKTITFHEAIRQEKKYCRICSEQCTRLLQYNYS